MGSLNVAGLPEGINTHAKVSEFADDDHWVQTSAEAALGLLDLFNS